MSREDERIDTSKYEGHQPAPWRWVRPIETWFLYAEQGNHSDLNHERGGIWLPDTFCRLGKGLDPTHTDLKSTYDLIADAPEILAELKRCYEEIDRLHDREINTLREMHRLTHSPE